MKRPTLQQYGSLMLIVTLITTATAAAQVPSSQPTGNNEQADDDAVPRCLESIDLLTLEVPNVVTTLRRQQRVETLPYAVTVISANDIREAGAHTIPDALRLAPGVDIAQLSSNEAAVGIRGLHGILTREILVLVDGRQIFDSMYGSAVWASWPFQIEDIDRIEVIRGPAGVEWGANAFNGVINIVTKDPADQKGLTFTGAGGSQSWNKEHIGYAFADKKLRMRVSGEYDGSNGFPRGGSMFFPLDDDYKVGRASVHAIYDAGPDDTLTLSGGSALTDAGLPTAPWGDLLQKRSASSVSNFLLGKWDRIVNDDNRFTVTGYVNYYYNCPALNALEYEYQQYALQFTQTFKPGDNHTFTWGIDSRTDVLGTGHSDSDATQKPNMGTAIFGLYAQNEWRFAPQWSFDIGGRIDYEFYGGFEPSARASLSYEIAENSLVYGAVSRAFQMPPLGSRFMTVPIMNGLGAVTSDQDVESEKLIAYELGYRGQPLRNLQTNAVLFCHTYDDLTTLSTIPGPPGLIQKHFENGFSSCLYGIELDAEYAVAKNLTLLGNYTFQIDEQYGRRSVSDTDSISAPKHKFMVGARYRPIERLSLSTHLYYVDEVNSPNPLMPSPFTRLKVPEYFRLDLRGEYEFWKDTGWVAVGVQNLLDPHHIEGASEYQNSAEVPRMFYAEIRLTFK